jgi:hypothetical protein
VASAVLTHGRVRWPSGPLPLTKVAKDTASVWCSRGTACHGYRKSQTTLNSENIVERLRSSLRLGNKFPRRVQRVHEFGRIFTAATRMVRLATALATDYRRDGLDDFTRGNLRRVVFPHRRNE